MLLSEDANSFVWLIFLGICIAAFYAYFTKKFLGGLVRKLISEKAASESTAKTLKELGYSGLSCYLMKKNLVEGKGLRRYVNIVYPETEEKSNDSLFSDANIPEQKYFLPFENYELAEKRYDDKGTTLLTVVLTIVVFFIVALMTTVILPFFTGIFGGDSGTSGNTNPNDFGFSDNSGTPGINDAETNINSKPSSSETVPDEEFSMLTPSVTTDGNSADNE